MPRSTGEDPISTDEFDFQMEDDQVLNILLPESFSHLGRRLLLEISTETEEGIVAIMATRLKPEFSGPYDTEISMGVWHGDPADVIEAEAELDDLR